MAAAAREVAASAPPSLTLSSASALSARPRPPRQCYYIDPIKRELSTPLKNGAPVSVVCQKLKKKSAEICALKFGDKAAVKLTADTDISKLKVAQLKEIIATKNIPCASCFEKEDFVAHIKAAIAAKGGEL